MGNGVKNAGFLDGTTAFTTSVVGALALADGSGGDTRGAPGRHVIKHTGTTVGTNTTPGVTSASPYWAAVTAGQIIEVHGYCWSNQPGVKLQVNFRNAGGTALRTDDVPKLRAGSGVAQRGLPTTFDRFYGRLAAAPATTAFVDIRSTIPIAASGVAFENLLLKPHIEVVSALIGDPRRWDPGTHINTDLNLPIWPDSLARFQAQAGDEPVPNREAYVTRSGVPRPRKLYTRPRVQWRGRLRCDEVQRDTLQQFYELGYDEFYLVRPDTDQLCVASFMVGGEPRTVEVKGPSRIMEIGLILDVA